MDDARLTTGGLGRYLFVDFSGGCVSGLIASGIRPALLNPL
jgi:hypothetical protein